MKDPSKEVVAACISALCGAERLGLREKVLAVIRTYEDMRRQRIEARCPGCGYTEQQWGFRKLRNPPITCTHPAHWGGPTPVCNTVVGCAGTNAYPITCDARLPCPLHSGEPLTYDDATEQERSEIIEATTSRRR